MDSNAAATYDYNPLGQRISKTINNTQEIYGYDEAGQLISVTDANGNPQREHIYFNNQPVAFVTNNTIYYIHTDHLNTPQVVTDQNQQMVWMGDYQPFGRLTDTASQTNSIELYSRFPGQYLDSETGLYYNYFRDYDPSMGRYIQSDPIGLEGGINTYSYASNNPLKYIDPLGLYQMCHRDLLMPIPYGRHCYVKFEDGTTSSYDPTGVGLDPDPNQAGTVCTEPQEPKKDDCIKKAMQQCNGPDYEFTKFNCCHCVEQALKECGTSIPTSSWPNWPANPGPQRGEPGYNPKPVYGPHLGK